MSIFERVIYNQIDPCPYIDGEESRTPLRLQVSPPTLESFDTFLSKGDRRVGQMLYRTECPSCQACEPIRVPVQTFKRSKSMRKIWNKNQDLRVELREARFCPEALQLYNRHKLERGLAKNETAMSRSGYENWFTFSCVPTAELRYFLEDKLICVSILDIGKLDTSSVYVFFDPDYSERSLGTFSALFEIDWMQNRAMRYYYLGLYVAQCQHLSYKSRFYPHDRLVKGEWHRFPSRTSTLATTELVPFEEKDHQPLAQQDAPPPPSQSS